ncbi:MAG: dockerin type I repeat-containing protein, partial [Candidatus Zixiibacteriota bacterium]
SWIDNGDGYLSYCDTIDFVNLLDGRKIWEHVELVTPTITVTTLDDPPDTIYLDELDPNPMCTTLTNPVGTYWHEVYPTYGTIWQITNWNDNGNGYLDSCDVITIEIPGGISPQDVHVEAVETDIVTTPLPTPGDEYDHNIDGYIPSMGSPVGTWWHELWPSYCTQYYLDDWHDNGDSILSYCDTIRFSGLIPEDTVWKHIEEVTGTIKVSAPQEPETLYFDFMCGNPNVDPITDPFNTYWHQIWPVFSIRHVCVGWTDNGNLVLDSCDWIDLMAIDGPDSGVVTSYHVEAWETDIITTIVQLGPPEDTCEYYKNQYGDYAPFSVPDFDQKQDGWTGPPLGGWSHCGPVALADCFWWIDSRFEDPTSPPPPTISDSYPLVQNYTGTFVDDHDTMNVIPFVDSLAIYCNTNGSPPPYPGGTWIMDLYNGAVQWISNRGLDTVSNWLKVDLIPSPDFETIQDEVLKSEDVILLLGFYEQHGPDIYCRLGGHYVTAAGVCTTETRICISDPWYDENEGEPPAGSAHGSSIHNDAQFISGPHGQIHHDAYFSPNNPLPDPTHPQPPIVELTDYPDYWPDIANFMEMNQTEPQMPYCQWQGGPILTMVEYAVVVSPCCVGIRGDVDGSGTINVADVTYLVAYLKGMGPAPPCFEEADADGSGSINVADVTYLVAYLKGLGPAPPSCP